MIQIERFIRFVFSVILKGEIVQGFPNIFRFALQQQKNDEDRYSQPNNKGRGEVPGISTTCRLHDKL
jgi:hypothetical protein